MFLHQGLWYFLFILSQEVSIWCTPPKQESKPRNRKIKIKENGVLPRRWVKGVSRRRESLRWQLCTKKESVPTFIWADQKGLGRNFYIIFRFLNIWCVWIHWGKFSSMGFSRQGYWSGLPFPSPGDWPNPGIEPRSFESPSVTGRFFTSEPHGKPILS